MYLTLNTPTKIAKYIKSVTYRLHPTFKPRLITVIEAPFLLSRVGYGTFEIDMDVEFKPSTSLGIQELSHCLHFHDEGKSLCILLQIPEDEAIERNKQSVLSLLIKIINKFNHSIIH